MLTMQELPLKGSLHDNQLQVISNAGLLLEGGTIKELGNFNDLKAHFENSEIEIISIDYEAVVLPSFVDAHTHICFAGSRANDFAMRNAGVSYLEIAKAGGGIWDTVTKTRKASKEELIEGIVKRAKKMILSGISTIEVKSGYGLSVSDELKMLEAIEAANELTPSQLIPTCLAAHIKPKDFDGSHEEYLRHISNELFPQIAERKLCSRVDAFIEEEAFDANNIDVYFNRAKELGFDITVHADQFSTGGSEIAVKYGAISADHLEASTQKEIDMLASSDVISTALPGATIGLGCAFTPARKILDAGGALAIASDWNPGSAPMGDLLTQASILATFEKLTTAEVLAGITYRAAAALKLVDRGVLQKNKRADFVVYKTDNYNEILYHQGQLKPSNVWINGQMVYNN